MMHTIPRGNWPRHLADAIGRSNPGDVIVCHTNEMGWMARSAAERMQKPRLRFELEDGTEVPPEPPDEG